MCDVSCRSRLEGSWSWRWDWKVHVVVMVLVVVERKGSNLRRRVDMPPTCESSKVQLRGGEPLELYILRLIPGKNRNEAFTSPRVPTNA